MSENKLLNDLKKEKEIRLQPTHSGSNATASSAKGSRRCWLDNHFDFFRNGNDDVFLDGSSGRSRWRCGSSLVLSPRDGVGDRSQVNRSEWNNYINCQKILIRQIHINVGCLPFREQFRSCRLGRFGLLSDWLGGSGCGGT